MISQNTITFQRKQDIARINILHDAITKHNNISQNTITFHRRKEHSNISQNNNISQNSYKNNFSQKLSQYTMTFHKRQDIKKTIQFPKQ